MGYLIEFIVKYYLYIILSLLSGLFVHLYNKTKSLQVDYNSIREGVKSLLRSEIINSFMRVKVRSNGSMDVHEKDNVSELYDSYKLLKGNGTIDDLMVELRNIPVRNDREG